MNSGTIATWWAKGEPNRDKNALTVLSDTVRELFFFVFLGAGSEAVGVLKAVRKT